MEIWPFSLENAYFYCKTLGQSRNTPTDGESKSKSSDGIFCCAESFRCLVKDNVFNILMLLGSSTFRIVELQPFTSALSSQTSWTY